MGSSPAWVTSWELIWQGNTITVLVPVFTDTCPGTKEISARVIRMWSALKMTWVRLKPRLWTERGLPFCKRKCQWSMNAGSQRTINKTHSYPTSEGNPSFGTCDAVGQRSGTEVMIECCCRSIKETMLRGRDGGSECHTQTLSNASAWRETSRLAVTHQKNCHTPAVFLCFVWLARFSFSWEFRRKFPSCVFLQGSVVFDFWAFCFVFDFIFSLCLALAKVPGSLQYHKRSVSLPLPTFVFPEQERRRLTLLTALNLFLPFDLRATHKFKAVSE